MGLGLGLETTSAGDLASLFSASNRAFRLAFFVSFIYEWRYKRLRIKLERVSKKTVVVHVCSSHHLHGCFSIKTVAKHPNSISGPRVHPRPWHYLLGQQTSPPMEIENKSGRGLHSFLECGARLVFPLSFD